MEKLDAQKKQNYMIGVISDTHGLLREEVLNVFKECDIILHAGDIGNLDVIKALEDIAPVVAVRGNCDRGEVAAKFPETNAVEIGDITIYLIHDLNKIDISPRSGFDCIISGHTHRPHLSKEDDIMYLNPGSAGPRRFNLPISVAKLHIDREIVNAELIEL